MKVDGINITETARLRMLADMETEETECLERMVPNIEDSGIRRLESLLDVGATAEVLRMTPSMWKEKKPHEKRALYEWTKRRIKALTERALFMERNGAEDDPELPAYLRERGAA